MTIKPIRNPTPVVLITPTTIPTAADAAPTANAYLTPSVIASDISGILIRCCGFNVPIRVPATSSTVIDGSNPPSVYFHTTKAIKAAA